MRTQIELAMKKELEVVEVVTMRESLDVFGLGLVKKMVELLPSILLLTHVRGQLLKLHLRQPQQHVRVQVRCACWCGRD